MLITYTPLIFVVAFCVTCCAYKDDLFLGKSYNYNHPPLFDQANEDSANTKLEVRKVRQVKLFENKEQEDNNFLKNINSNSDIPVTVVNDPESNNNLNSNRIQKRKQARRPIPIQEKKEEWITTENVQEKESTTKRYSSTSPSPKTVVPKVFTKRPPEDNPKNRRGWQRQPAVKIVESTNRVYAQNGNFRYSFEGADGTKVSSQGKLKTFDDDKTGEAVVGSVSYTDDEGNDFSLSYTADENGYRPHGDHLPTPPPIPPAIARALAHLATKTTPLPNTEATFDTA